MNNYLLAIDQGTTSSRAIIFDRAGKRISQHQIDLKQFYPQPGWVEQDPEEMWLNTLACCQQSLKKSGLSAQQIAGVGITNQRETTIVWNRETGLPIYPAIVWQDRRTAALCEKLAKFPFFGTIQQRTGLLLDPYFSATKLYWILENVPNASSQAEQGVLAFGTVDSFLLWRLTKGRVHATDASNAARTLLFNIRNQEWDQDTLEAFGIPRSLMPEVFNNCAEFGSVAPEFLGAELPVLAMAGDQQAALVGQACFEPGMVKSTFGTGCFMVLNTGTHLAVSKHKLLSTIAYRLNNQVTYALEGSIFSAGTIVKWLRDKLQLIESAAESEAMAKSIASTAGVYLIPAFTGLGAPYWKPDVGAAFWGLTADSARAHLVRAGLEAVVYQTADLLEAMQQDGNVKLSELRVDGGMVVNTWLLQFLADILQLTIVRPSCIETTALGVAYLAGLQAGMYQDLNEIAALWRKDVVFKPTMDVGIRKNLYEGWQSALRHVL